MRHRLAGKYVRTMHAVLPGRIFFLGATEAVEVGCYAHVVKTQFVQE